MNLLEALSQKGSDLFFDEMAKQTNEKCYTQDEVYEILRQVMFTGTPELYDQGGMHRNYNLKPDHTLQRAKEAFKKYYLKQ